MTLARYEGTGLAEVTAAPGLPRTPRWWRQPVGSRYCPRCLAANGGRWMLAWRIPWAFACTGCQVLLADTCPDCGRRHRRTRTGQPRQPGRCDLTGLPLPPPRPPRGGTHGLHQRSRRHAGHRAARRRAACCAPSSTSTPSSPRCSPPGASQRKLAALQQYLDDIHAVARAAVSALHGPAAPPAVVSAVVGELGAQPGTPGQATPAPRALAGPAHGQRRQLAPVTAFGVTIADIMLHGRQRRPRPGDRRLARRQPRPAAAETRQPGETCSPDWGRASPALQAALAKPLAARLDTFYQLRYRALAGPARIPDPAQADEHAAALPSLLWPGWALRLMPPEGFDFLRYRFALGMMLAVASAGAADYRTAQELLGLQPVHGSRFATFTARLREHGVLEPVTAAICQLARKLDEHGAPIDYARRRRLRRFSQAQLDITGWRRQRLLPHPPRHLGAPPPPDHADLPAAPVQEHLARLRLIELLTGTHPSYLPGPLRLPERHRQDYAEFVFTLPEPLARYLHHRARFLLRHASIDEPSPGNRPSTGSPASPGPAPTPTSISPADLHPLMRSGLPVRAIAARLGTTRRPRPAGRRPPPGTPASRPAARPRPRPSRRTPGTDQLRAFTGQGFGPRKIARITGCSERTIRQLLTSAGLRQPADRPTAASTRNGCASSTRRACAASRTSPPKPASRSEPSPPQPAARASPSGTAETAAPTRSPASADPAHSRQPSGTSSPAPAPNSASAGSWRPRAPQPQPRRPPTRHQARHPGQPDPPARNRHRHYPPAHRPQHADHADP